MGTNREIRGLGNIPCETPENVRQLGDCIRGAQAKNLAVFPIGGASKCHIGHVPKRPGIGIQTHELKQCIEYPARDMTITVQSGMTIQQLRELLRAEKQFLPVDLPFPDRSTVGGAIATNFFGLRRLGYGTLRDYVIGISAMNDEGVEIKGGGRVVKNVAGYDLMKLFIGSYGTLAFITQVTFKVVPLPEDRQALLISVAAAELPKIMEAIRQSATRPLAVDLFNQTALMNVVKDSSLATKPILNEQSIKMQNGSNSLWTLLVLFEGNREAVAWQTEQIQSECKQIVPSFYLIEPGDWQKLDERLADAPLYPEDSLLIKISILPGDVPDFCQRMQELFPLCGIRSHILNGIVYLQWFASELRNSAVNQSIFEKLQAILQEKKGTFQILQYPGAMLSDGGSLQVDSHNPGSALLPIWGIASPDRVAERTMMRKIKDKLDTRSVYNPGRFVDGI